MAKTVGIKQTWKQVFEMTPDSLTLADLSDMEMEFISQGVEAYKRVQDLLSRKYHARGYAAVRKPQPDFTVIRPPAPRWPIRKPDAGPVRGFQKRS